MEGGAVWVRVSLEAYFSDERARCMMSIPSDGGRDGGVPHVGWLARRLRRTFGLQRRPALLCQGHLLPPAEPLPTTVPLLQLVAIPPSGRVLDVSRQRASADDSQVSRVRVKRRRSPSGQRAHGTAAFQDVEPAPDWKRQPALTEADKNDEADGGSLNVLEEVNKNDEANGGSPSLDEMKKRALALLEGRAGGRRRRRVRRRRAAPPELIAGDSSPALNTSPAPDESPAPNASPAPDAQPDAGDAPAVLRNEEGSRRAPRHVRALSLPPPPAPYTEPPPPPPPGPSGPTSPDGHAF